MRNSRSALTIAPHAKLQNLRRLDDRLAAHLEGLAVAGDQGWRLCEEALESPGVGEMFAAGVRAIEDRSIERLSRLFSVAEALPTARSGLISAFGWVSPRHLPGITKTQLFSPHPFHRAIGLATCAMHMVDPGAVLGSAIGDEDALLRARALRTAGELGRQDLLATCVGQMTDGNDSCRFWAAHSAVLLGNRDAAVQELQGLAMQAGPHRGQALKTLLKVVNAAHAHSVLRAVASDAASARLLIKAIGIAGDTMYVSWLIKQMKDLKLTRLAGETFSFMIGIDLASHDLDRVRPEDFESGPDDNPDDPDVSVDADESLPWPDPMKIEAWWDANRSRFTEGVRYFVGEPVTQEHCIHVLTEGYQHQRIAAAEHLCLLQPGKKLFPTRAPAWRQQRWLSQMS